MFGAVGLLALSLSLQFTIAVGGATEGASETFLLGDRVWHDVNDDGAQDAGEPGIGGVQVRLTASDGTELAEELTAADGSYRFTNVLPGDYRVQADTPAGYVGSEPEQTTSDLDSDGYTNSTRCVGGVAECERTLVIAVTDSDLTLDFGFLSTTGSRHNNTASDSTAPDSTASDSEPATTDVGDAALAETGFENARLIVSGLAAILAGLVLMFVARDRRALRLALAANATLSQFITGASVGKEAAPMWPGLPGISHITRRR
jgi:uncharacterized surface anchored protein